MISTYCTASPVAGSTYCKCHMCGPDKYTHTHTHLSLGLYSLTCLKARDVGFECAINEDLDPVGQSVAGRNPEREDVEGVDVQFEHGLLDAGVILVAHEVGAWRSAATSYSTETSAARTARGGAYRSPCVVRPRAWGQAVQRLQVAIIKAAADQQICSGRDDVVASLFW